MSGEEDFEEWDADFLEQLIQVEEIALSANPNTTTSATQAVAPLSSRPPHLPQQHQQIYNHDFSYSPPRELSQRPPNDSSYFDRSISGITTEVTSCRSSVQCVPKADRAKDLEIQRLKGELGRVSKQLTELEYECSELRKERKKKDEQLISVCSHYEEKGSGFHSMKCTDLGRGVVTEDPRKVSQQFKQAKSINEIVGSRNNDRRTISTCRAIGVQTEKAIDVIPITSHGDHPTCPDLSEKLMGIWQSTSDQEFEKKLISALFRTCATDFHVLFGCMGMNASPKMRGDSMADESTSVVALDYWLHSPCTSEAEKVSHLYSVLTKISTGMLKLDALFKLLVDLCSLENVVIVHRSLRILRVFLKHLFYWGRKAELRDNVKFEGLCSSNKLEDFSGPECMKNRASCFVAKDGTFYAGNMPFGIQPSTAEILCEKEPRNHETSVLLSCINWGSLFEHMHQIAMKSTEECIRLEAVSTMNEIVMRNSTYVEREKFGTTLLFESISQLLRKESGLLVQKEALHLLHLLLNCPKLLAIFCSSCIKGDSTGAADDDVLSSLTCKGLHSILESLTDCIACTGNGVKVLELRRNSIILLSFLASTGRSGVEILINYKLSREANFLMFILQVLVSEVDAEAAVCAEPRICSEPADICKARNLLMREVLILLNRLVSNAAYSASVLRVLTNSRDMASLTIDIANRLSRWNQKLCQLDSTARQMRESEIIDLARVFKRRVFAYLGENVS
ncbi:protein SENSITIVE TO UV 2 isoform X2 [Tripterygium wilfordii]|uniref:protein SENSITIVE TO UV 2 isoform X2 n=1 Tax=Tripterygium wilfordii TaxID=458696 RepID=UPI0018F7FE18|nr:protein SENSITIVE TO UV 2 isoform X2 [Tripterygium wilfordii]